MSGIVADNIDRQSGVIAEPAGGPEVRSDDPSASAGTVWFNTTSGVLKVYRTVAGWSSGGNLNTGRKAGSGTVGTQSACFIAGGDVSGGRTLNSETYNGSSWTSTGDLTGSARGGGGSWGTSTAGAQAGGWQYPGSVLHTLTNLFDGTSWSDPSDALTGSYTHGACGTQSAAISRVGGYTGSAWLDSCEEYNGTAHVSGGDISSNIYGQGTCGTLTSAIAAGGGGYPAINTCQTYDGTSWDSSAALATARRTPSAFGASDSDANVSGGHGASDYLTSCEVWNGTSWSAGDSISLKKLSMQGAGNTSTLGLIAGGNPAYINVTEEFTEALTAMTLSNS